MSDYEQSAPPSGQQGCQLWSRSDFSKSKVQSERVLSSSVIGSQCLTSAPEEQVQYVEVPVIEEVIRRVPRKEIIQVERRVPKYEFEWVEKIVEVPQTQIIDKHVEVPKIQEVVKHIPVKQTIDVPREVIRYVPKVETRIVEQEVEVVGETIEVPKPYLVENKVVVPRYIDKEIPTVVAQRLQPIITESETDFVDIELKEYNPQLIPVDVYIPRPVTRNLIAAAKHEEHKVVDVPPAQYNALVRTLNSSGGPGGAGAGIAESIYVKLPDGTVPMLHGVAGSTIVPPESSDWKEFHTPGRLRVLCPPGGYVTTNNAGIQVVHAVGPNEVSSN